MDAGPYEPATWLEVELGVDAGRGTFDLNVAGKNVLKEAKLAQPVESVDRLSFRTGEHRTEPTRQTLNEAPHQPLPGADDPAQEAVFYVDDVRVE